MKRHIRSISMVLAFLVGGIFHRQLAPLGDWLPASVALMLSITFLGIDASRLRPQRMHLWLLLGIYWFGKTVASAWAGMDPVWSLGRLDCF